MLMTTHATLTPRLYWEKMLPSTPMPKAITELLSLGSHVSKGQNELFRFVDGAKEIPTQDSESVIIYHIAQETQLYNHHSHEKPTSTLFLLEEDLREGNKFNVQFNKTKEQKFPIQFLPRQVSKHVSFSLDNMKRVLETLDVKPNSNNTATVAKTIRDCDAPPGDSERKRCATSLESMVDFVTSTLGSNVRALPTEVERKTNSQKFVIVKDGVERLGDDKVIACHRMSYTYVVFGCHRVQKTRTYLVRLEGEDGGVGVKAVVACHRDTSIWDPNHVAFRVLRVKPGNGTVCHVFPEGHLLWVPK